MARRTPTRALVALVGTGALAVLAAAQPVAAQEAPTAPIAPDEPGAWVAPEIRWDQGQVDVVLRLSAPAVVETVADGALTTGALPSADQQRATAAAAEAQQDQVLADAAALGASEQARVSLAINAVVVSVDAKAIDQLAEVPGVVSIRPVGRYQTYEDTDGGRGHGGGGRTPESGSLAQAAAYLDVTAARAKGLDGSGVTIAVLDSGVDYTHANLGGPGSVAIYDQCYAQRDVAPSGPCKNLFGRRAPKVKGGYDFVGETWAAEGDALEPDPNPIDLEGHGTHVADIAAGRSRNGKHLGIAPGADVLAVKVCSAVATACSGTALLQGMDFALDPDGDGDLRDAVDVINLSLGSPYGQPQDDLTAAVDNAVASGVVVVASAGNDGDRPWIVGSPSTAAGAISVAQTALPDEVLYPIAVQGGATYRNAVPQTWAPIPPAAITAPLAVPAVGTGCTVDDFAGFPAGAIAVIARGVCNVSLKSDAARQAGAVAAVIYDNRVADAPPSFSFGGGTPVPTLTLTQADGQALAAAAGATATVFDKATAVPLVNTTVGTSARGPAIDGGRVKPDIGAPGAWLSAEVGTGNAETNFGGTSGAAPVVTGAAAIVLEAHRRATPAEVKQRLVNNASLANTTPDPNAVFFPTPVTRIGGGEVRVNTAVTASSLVGDPNNGNGNLSFGVAYATTGATVLERSVTVTNTSNRRQTYTLSFGFRDPSDAALGALAFSAPSVTLNPGATATVPVTATLDGSKLPAWIYDGTAGALGHSGSIFTGPELDGYVTVSSRSGTDTLGWQVLPKRAADTSASGGLTTGVGGTLDLANASTVADGVVEAFQMVGVSPLNPDAPGAPGSNEAIVDLLGIGMRTVGDQLQVGLQTNPRKSTPAYPAYYEVGLDVDGDGGLDHVVFSQEISGAATDGRVGVFVVDLSVGDAVLVGFADADFDSGNVILGVPLADLGITDTSTPTPINGYVAAADNYFTGEYTDVVLPIVYTVGLDAYPVSATTVVAPGGTASLTVGYDPTAVSTSSGVLLLFRNDAGDEAFQAAAAV